MMKKSAPKRDTLEDVCVNTPNRHSLELESIASYPY
jgi:hypothetical protein